MSGLSGKAVLVTGAARGTGRVHCERFADEGAHIIALDAPDRAQELRATASAVEQRGSRCVISLADVCDGDAMAAAIGAAVGCLGPLSVVVANAGVHPEGAPTWELTQELWDTAWGVNVLGVWHTVKPAIKHFGDAGGAIVIIGSTAGIRGAANCAHYTASKHAVVGLARTLANELGAQRIRVNTVHPGAVGTATILNEATYRRLRPDLKSPTAQDAAEVLMARHILPVAWVEPVDVSNAVVFLASDQARYITGTELIVDAGLVQKT